jgi:hypothetical protein
MKTINRDGKIIWIYETWRNDPSALGDVHREGAPAILLANGVSAMCDFESIVDVISPDGEEAFINDWMVHDALLSASGRT